MDKSSIAFSDNLSRALQSKKMSAISGQKMAKDTIDMFEGMRNERDAKLLFDLVKQKAEQINCISKPTLGRKKNLPKYSTLNLLDGYSSSESYNHKTPADYFRQVYYEVIDTFLWSLKDRFEQESYQYYAKMENVLLTAINRENVCKEGLQLLENMYSDDINIDSLLVELSILKHYCQDLHIVCFDDIHDFLKQNQDKMTLIPNIVNLVMLLLINPSTSATPERTFSMARRLKTWNRSTMTQKRFNSIAILNNNKQYTDKLSLVDIANEFASKNEKRKFVFGKFILSDIC